MTDPKKNVLRLGSPEFLAFIDETINTNYPKYKNGFLEEPTQFTAGVQPLTKVETMKEENQSAIDKLKPARDYAQNVENFRKQLAKYLEIGHGKNDPRIVFHCEYVDSPEDGMYPRLISDPGKASDSDDKSLFAGMDYMTYTYEKKYNPPPITLKPEDGGGYQDERVLKFLYDHAGGRFHKREWQAIFDLGETPTVTVVGVGVFPVTKITVYRVHKIVGEDHAWRTGLTIDGGKEYAEFAPLLREIYKNRRTGGRKGKMGLYPKQRDHLDVFTPSKSGDVVEQFKPKIKKAHRTREDNTGEIVITAKNKDAIERFGEHRTPRTGSSAAMGIAGTTIEECIENMTNFCGDSKAQDVYDVILGKCGMDRFLRTTVTAADLTEAVGMDRNSGKCTGRVAKILDSLKTIRFYIYRDKDSEHMTNLFTDVETKKTTRGMEYTFTMNPNFKDSIGRGEGIRFDTRAYWLPKIAKCVYLHYQSLVSLNRERQMFQSAPLRRFLADAGIPLVELNNLIRREGEPQALEMIREELTELIQALPPIKNEPAVRLMNRAEVVGSTFDNSTVILEGDKLYPLWLKGTGALTSTT